MKSLMKYLFLVNLILSIFFFSCNSNNNKSGEEEEGERIESTDSTSQNKLDMFSVGNFLVSFIEARKKTIAENNDLSKVKISGKRVYEDTYWEIKIIQINETIGNNVTEYSIAAGVSNPLTYQIGDKYDDIKDLLDSQNIKYSLFRGHFEKTVDFNDDGSSEFLLKNID